MEIQTQIKHDKTDKAVATDELKTAANKIKTSATSANERFYSVDKDPSPRIRKNLSKPISGIQAQIKREKIGKSIATDKLKNAVTPNAIKIKAPFKKGATYSTINKLGKSKPAVIKPAGICAPVAVRGKFTIKKGSMTKLRAAIAKNPILSEKNVYRFKGSSKSGKGRILSKVVAPVRGISHGISVGTSVSSGISRRANAFSSGDLGDSGTQLSKEAISDIGSLGCKTVKKVKKKIKSKLQGKAKEKLKKSEKKTIRKSAKKAVKSTKRALKKTTQISAKAAAKMTGKAAGRAAKAVAQTAAHAAAQSAATAAGSAAGGTVAAAPIILIVIAIILVVIIVFATVGTIQSSMTVPLNGTLGWLFDGYDDPAQAFEDFDNNAKSVLAEAQADVLAQIEEVDYNSSDILLYQGSLYYPASSSCVDAIMDRIIDEEFDSVHFIEVLYIYKQKLEQERQGLPEAEFPLVSITNDDMRQFMGLIDRPDDMKTYMNCDVGISGNRISCPSGECSTTYCGGYCLPSDHDEDETCPGHSYCPRHRVIIINYGFIDNVMDYLEFTESEKSRYETGISLLPTILGTEETEETSGG